MLMRLPPITILIRAAGLVLFVWYLPYAWIAWQYWEEIRRVQSLHSAGMVTGKEIRQSWSDFLYTAWPLAAAVILFFAAPFLARLATRGLHPPGSCPRCGYDLRGSPPGPCPECGTPAPRQ
jgi:hypothetical protein